MTTTSEPEAPPVEPPKKRTKNATYLVFRYEDDPSGKGWLWRRVSEVQAAAPSSAWKEVGKIPDLGDGTYLLVNRGDVHERTATTRLVLE